MEKEFQENLSLKDKYNKMEEYQSIYIHAILELNKSGVDVSEYTLFDSKDFIETKKRNMLCFGVPESNAKRIIVSINCILIAMDSVEANMIYFDFFFKQKKDWWVNLYSKSSYYRIRKNAMNNFLRLAGDL